MSKQQTRPTERSPLTAAVQCMQNKLDDPLRNDIIKTKNIANKTGMKSREIALVMRKIAAGEVDGVAISVWNGKRSNEGLLYKIEKIDYIPEHNILIDASLCNDFRNELVGTRKRLKDLASNYPFSKSVIGDHVGGSCNHDVDHPPIKRTNKYNQPWRLREQYR